MWGLVDIFCVVFRNLSTYIRTSTLIMQAFQCPFSFPYSVINGFQIQMIFSLPAHGLHESNQCTYLKLFFQSLGLQIELPLTHVPTTIITCHPIVISRAQTWLFFYVV